MSEERENQGNQETQERQQSEEKVRQQETEEKPNVGEKQERVKRVERRAGDAPAGARARAAGGRVNTEAEDQPKEPSPNQPFLDRIVELIKQQVHPEAIEQAYLNERDRDLPTLQIRGEYWLECAKLLKTHEELDFRYLRNIAGVDYETHMEVVYHMVSLKTKRQCCVKVTTDRDHPSVPSVEPIWLTANWNEREIYDLFGIQFPGHPDLRRIMMPDDWVGHPLRKDYEPYDPEV